MVPTWSAVYPASAHCAPTGQADNNRWSKRTSLRGGSSLLERSIFGVDYVNPKFPQLGIESLCLSELIRRVRPSHFASPQRPGFHLLMLFTFGRGDHFLDFRR